MSSEIRMDVQRPSPMATWSFSADRNGRSPGNGEEVQVRAGYESEMPDSPAGYPNCVTIVRRAPRSVTGGRQEPDKRITLTRAAAATLRDLLGEALGWTGE